MGSKTGEAGAVRFQAVRLITPCTTRRFETATFVVGVVAWYSRAHRRSE